MLYDVNSATQFTTSRSNSFDVSPAMPPISYDINSAIPYDVNSAVNNLGRTDRVNIGAAFVTAQTLGAR